jgi:flavin reductase (DIM6/NTAB) family NADH-FMN oxidoreductase RutF
MTPAQAAFRQAIARFATGVAVITTVDEAGQRHGMTASAVASLSLDPILLLVCLGRHLPTHAAIESSGRFVVSVLAEGHERTALKFARPADDKFAGVRLREVDDLPVLEDAISYFVCDVHEQFPGGDHSIFAGAVRDCGTMVACDPLVYFERAFRRVSDPHASVLAAALAYDMCV